MSVNTLETPAVPPTWQQDDEIDLRQYLDVVIRWWREIVLIAAGVAALAALSILALRLVTPPSYVATASVAIARTVSDVSFDERFRTSPGEMDTASVNARRSALLGLVTTGSIANEVLVELGDLFSEEERDPSALLERIEGEPGPTVGTRADSDLILITAKADSPEKAAAIANAWARAYVRQINTVYGQVPDEVFDSIRAELATAEQSYHEAQSRLEAFLADNQAKELNNRLSVIQQRMDQEVALIQSYLGEWQRANEYRNTAQALRTQLEQGGEGAVRSTMPALQTLKITIFGRPSGNFQFELRDLPEMSQAAMLADVDGLIAALEERLAGLEAEITSRSDGLHPGDGVTPATLTAFTPMYAEIRQLQARIEAESARRAQLEQQRTLNWESYKALSNKVAELNLTRAASSSEVRFAAAAVPPAEPERGISLSVGTGAAGVAGLLLALMFVFLADYLGRQPFLRRQVAR
ncbi:MAG: hypothetical protein KJZ93_12445 [Caldilineaceae bacterium]|nr:hypothetical protein [Caldilineaceae bacterium]